MFDRWRSPGDEEFTNIPALPPGNINVEDQVSLPIPNATIMNQYDMYNRSDIRVADTDFIRCRNLSLQYDLPKHIIENLHARRISLSVSMTNPFMIVFDKKWAGMDPETGSWPSRRTVSFSLGVNF